MTKVKPIDKNKVQARPREAQTQKGNAKKDEVQAFQPAGAFGSLHGRGSMNNILHGGAKNVHISIIPEKKLKFSFSLGCGRSYIQQAFSFSWGLSKDLIITLTTLAIYFSAGYAFYSNVESWSLVDVIYFSICTITTVGYGDVTPKTDEGLLFTIFYQFCGVAIAGAALGNLVNGFLKWQEGIRHRLVSKASRHVLARAKTLTSGGGDCHRKSRSNIVVSAASQTRQSFVTAKRLAKSASSKASTKFFYTLAIVKILLPLVVFIMLGLIVGHIEDWNTLQSVYAACVTVTGVGYGDFAPATERGRIFAIFFIPLGIVVMLNTVSNVLLVLVRKAHARDISPKEWLEMDVDGDGKVTQIEFVEHMLISMNKVDKGTLDILHEQFRTLSLKMDGGNDYVDSADVKKLSTILDSDYHGGPLRAEIGGARARQNAAETSER